MCDALATNKPGRGATLIQVYCLDHGRRQFVDIRSSYPKQCDHVIGQLARVYKVDKETKRLGMNDEERLAYHQEHSAPIIAELGKWMQKQQRQELAEENSPLGKVIDYFLKCWTEMTEFLHTPGVPLSNSECERAIKLIITHRKNSLFYKTENGARRGDVIQSLLATCQKAGINCFGYLAWLQENKPKVKAHPGQDLSWQHDQQN